MTHSKKKKGDRGGKKTVRKGTQGRGLYSVMGGGTVNLRRGRAIPSPPRRYRRGEGASLLVQGEKPSDRSAGDDWHTKVIGRGRKRRPGSKARSRPLEPEKRRCCDSSFKGAPHHRRSVKKKRPARAEENREE